MGVRNPLSLSSLDIGERFWHAVRYNWYLGFTSFGGPPVHFKIFHDKYVDKLSWITEDVYQELFSVCQAFSGPGSTKMHYCINLLHDGFLPAVLSFLIWSLPGALGMYGLSIGVSNIGDSLPRAVYALLSGLNAATVGIIVLAAVQLSEKAITDTLTRILVFLGATAGLMYNALWYFPLLMFMAGITAVVHDFRWLHGPVKSIISVFQRKSNRTEEPEDGVELQPPQTSAADAPRGQSDADPGPSAQAASKEQTEAQQRPGSANDAASAAATEHTEPSEEARVVPEARRLNISWKFGLFLIGLFLVSFVIIMVLRGTLPNKNLLYSLFANMYLAGTIIFGGGPVVIPLLREYIVAEGWVSPRDFLIGLALIQAWPGPNFNFAVYLGSLTAINGGYNSAAGAILGFLGIFVPGLVTVHGTMGVWNAVRSWRSVKSGLRGINAAAVGLIYTAVYRLWQIGHIDQGFQQGTSLAIEPWWVVVTATSYVGGYWFRLSPPVAIVMGAVMGLICRVGVVTGANKGIGLAIVRQLALQYPKSHINNGPLLVYLTARDESRGKEALSQLHSDQQLKKAGALAADGGLTDIKFQPLDIGAKESIGALRAYLTKEHPDGIDFIINNAGIAMNGFDINVVKNTLGINYYGTLEATLDLSETLRSGGRIVNVASISGALRKYPAEIKDRFINAASVDEATKLMQEFTSAVERGEHEEKGWPSAAYAVSKAGLIAQTRALAKQFKAQGKDLLINSCHPGYVVTDMTRGGGNKTPDEGAQTPVLLAIEDVGSKSGTYWSDEKEVDWATT
ncbi:Carbonyl reductase [NADPH] 3 [Paramyrothecium foliicola]|nr:Carbonyl reductase [NADPH] 3 [Paramyrothecium foliicola]